MKTNILRKALIGVILLMLMLAFLVPALPVLAASASISVDPSSVVVDPGGSQEIAVRVSLTDITVLQVTLQYDPAVCRFLSSRSGDLGDITVLPTPPSADGEVDMAYFDQTLVGKTGNFVLVYLTLEATGNPGDTCNLNLIEASAADNGDPEPHSVTPTVSGGTFTIRAPEHTVTANPDTYITPMDTPLNIAAAGVLTNDTDSLGHPLTVAEPRPTTVPGHGTLTLNADGSFSYTPTTGYFGDDSFTYTAACAQVTSQQPPSADATVTIDVKESMPPDAVIATPDSYSTPKNTALNIAAPGVLTNDTDSLGHPLTVAEPRPITGPAHGTLTLNADGSFTYTPSADYVGPDSFTYKPTDGHVPSDPADVTIDVMETPIPPSHVVVANPDSYSTPMNTTLTVSDSDGVLANDTDSLGHTLNATLVSSVSHGTLTTTGHDGFTYTPNNGFTGDDTFTYTATCGQATSDPATVTIHVTKPEERLPVAVDDSYCTPEGETLDVCAPGILGNDTNPDQAPLSAILVTDVSHGTLTLNADGSFTYEPDCGFTGEDTFTYRAIDTHEHQSNIATVTIIVEETPAPPIPEIATGVLCFIGLAGTGGFFLLRRHRRATQLAS